MRFEQNKMINTQPTLENEKVILQPLTADDFESLYEAASNPKIWEQHPNKDRWKKEVFRTFFEGAMLSKGAFKITDKQTGKIIGSSRYYDHNEEDSSIFIGYTFYTIVTWGTGINKSVKKIMLDYILQFVNKVYFHIGSNNMRSQIAISRIGAKKIAEQEVIYYGETKQLNFVFEITFEHWKDITNNN